MTSLNLSVAEIAALVGHPARTNMITVLMDGRALTATELAYASGVAAQTASGHLARLVQAKLLAVRKQGRHRYYQLASPLVGRMLESIMAVAAAQPAAPRRLACRLDEEMRTARTCYDHIAGRLGVGLADSLSEQGCVVMADDGGELTEKGEQFLLELGVLVPPRRHLHRAYCRPCLDWSERRTHIAGAVGAALCTRCLEVGWVKRRRDTRALEITVQGRIAFEETFGIGLTQPCADIRGDDFVAAR